MQTPAIVFADSVTKPTEAWIGAVLVSASHGGVYAAYCAAKAGVRAVILNDAGRGKDDAGIGGGAWCEALGLAYAAIDTMSARIGNAEDMGARGVISTVNTVARSLGVAPGQSVSEASQLLTAAPIVTAEIPDYEEARTELPPGPSGRHIVLADSASLIGPQDVGQVIVCGSHGGMLGSDPKTALKVDGFAAFYNDAGGGADGAGFTRLPALDERGIAAGTVAAMSARIGDGRSTYEDGVLSRVNETARRLGGAEGMMLKAFAQRLIA
ncbi:hypothetical protein T8K17_09010 [Thalassobaculum sp. OXR-137]|uniref:hypothetical protein n=1 Tax=Thalassobaculum sp. OXR-137 TaxID=3100173 RepID=UPI002AC92253|nr:hypothetical protein [Thalassobaculum sp. OXR-137]WPZ36276.1 hypothetical protein T8K17_09010 [Thalassobaculum sp. OXR-137]